MRDIIFRGKWLDNGEWVEGNIFIPDKVAKREPPTEILIGTNVVRISYEVDPSTVGQYTGLCDKNGKKIFEGDIVECGYVGVEKFRYVIVYDAQLACFIGERHFGFVSLNGVDVEVIGNIYDNPELLKDFNEGV